MIWYLLAVGIVIALTLYAACVVSGNDDDRWGR